MLAKHFSDEQFGYEYLLVGSRSELSLNILRPSSMSSHLGGFAMEPLLLGDTTGMELFTLWKMSA